ncbi:MAG: DUF1501 domain-containing protein [Maricaulaceae bacterium]|jgi:uncharacterized protein (DUF1501 family)
MSSAVLNRRHVLALSGGVATWTLMGAPAHAQDASRPLVVVILRGGLDGLAAVAPYGDSRYRALRGELALAEPGEENGVLPLGDGLGLHPSLQNMHALYTEGQAAVLHAASTPYRSRSHFDGQDVLESGGDVVYGLSDGWLNRAIQRSEAGDGAVAVGSAVPLMLRGQAEASSWSPTVLGEAGADTLNRLMDLYAGDDLLGPALAAAAATDEVADASGMGGRSRGRGGQANFAASLQPAGRLIAEGAASAAVVSLDGWDTHANQGAATGQLANRLRALDEGLAALKEALGDKWSSSVVLVATEFGRTASVNGTRGTDHGTGGAAFVFGGAVRGGRILGDWPGLAQLHEDRDVRPANDLRGLFKGVLRDHWGVDRSDLDRFVFPESSGVRAMDGVIA